MIELAQRRARQNLSFSVCDYETGNIPAGFDAAVIYDSLHHAEDEGRVICNVFGALRQLVRATGLAAVIATHNLDIAAQMDRRVTIRDGLVVELE